MENLKAETFDFDKCFEEMQGEGIPFIIFGKEEKLPSQLPATLLLKIFRAQKEYGNNNLPESVQIDVAISIFGEQKVEEWANKGLGVNQLAEMIKWAIAQYNKPIEDNKKK